MRLLLMIGLGLLPLVNMAQSVERVNALEKAIVQFETLTDKQSCIYLDKVLDQLCTSSPSNWIPYYYASLVKIKLAMFKDKAAESYADKAIEAILKAKKLQANDEVFCVESLAYTTKMSLHSAWRWFTYERKIKDPLAAAKKINSNNPRIYVLEAMLQYKLPSVLGGSCKSALPLAQKAVQLLKQSSNLQRPNWGLASAQEVIKGCAF
jgi:hypothetical protein